MISSTDDMVRVLAAGGGLVIDATYKSTDELVRIAAAAGHSGAALHIHNLHYKSIDDLVRIGAASKGKAILHMEQGSKGSL